MIYFDNAATTMLKPPEVAEAVARAIGSFGGVGRGVHEASLDAGMTVFKARQKVSDLIGGPGAKHVAFAYNATEALNIAICGLLHAGDHAVTTAASHNSVLRPLFRMEDAGTAEVSVVPIAPDGSLDYDAFDAAFRPNTRLAVVTHASNLTGDVYDIARLARIAHDHGAVLVVDAAQTAGVIPIDMAAQSIDVVCFTGHKSLFGPQGTGGLVVAEGVDIAAFKVGGSGTHSYDRAHPTFMPERLEAGTLNAHGIAGLLAGLTYIERKSVDAIRSETQALAARFEEGVGAVPGVKLYGGGEGKRACSAAPRSNGDAGRGIPASLGAANLTRTGIVTLNIADVDSSLVADMLNAEFGICTRAGAHCAPLMHEALGTDGQGAVRFSFSHFNTADEVDAGIEAVAMLAKELV